ncbi:uncharacterized protein LOC125665731 isoform X3 [Ostrea edulis]|uniref:uncharacterized protein LOC125665731 isoform X3 n=2 Tax=Ostrea edulis TaxID=37623 RepID=UPI002094E9C6|nr:uncharacterized protein LOC125665731 isoform X3 [Ostrea edulis]
MSLINSRFNMNISGFNILLVLGILVASTSLVRAQGCSVECDGASSCFRTYNCTHFDQCYPLDSGCSCTRLMCSFGTFYSPASGVCDTVSKGLCDADPCLSRTVGEDYSYPSNFNCRSFYQCSKSGRSVPMCCRDNYRYDYDTQQCRPDKSCNISCSQREGQEYYNDYNDQMQKTDPYDCFLRPVVGKPSKYYNEVAKMEQDCAESTYYVPEKCGCDNLAVDIGVRRPICRALFSIDFLNETVSNYRDDVYMESDRVKIHKSEVKGIQYGQFNGRDSHIKLPYLRSKSLGKAFVRIRFYTAVGSGVQDQVLFSNCDAIDGKDMDLYSKPSFAIIINKPSKLLSFIAQTDNQNKTIIRLPYLDDAWNNVEMMYDGKVLTARVRALKSKGERVEEMDSKPLTGRVIAPKQNPKLGRCTAADAFLGYMDMVKVFDCVPV